jgi:hypothetical protein
MAGDDHSPVVHRDRPVGGPVADPADNGGEERPPGHVDVVEHQPRLAAGEDLNGVDDSREMVEGEAVDRHFAQLEVRLVPTVPAP